MEDDDDDEDIFMTSIHEGNVHCVAQDDENDFLDEEINDRMRMSTMPNKK